MQPEGVFGSHSLLALLSLPIAVWDLLQDKSAYRFIGFVTTPNLLIGAHDRETPEHVKVLASALSGLRAQWSKSKTPVEPQSRTKTSAFDVPEGRPTQIATRRKRKAPPPFQPKDIIAARALCDFEPDSDNDDESAFQSGDNIEIVELTAALQGEGWCRARVEGMNKIGLMTLEYLDIKYKVSAQPSVHDPGGEYTIPSLKQLNAISLFAKSGYLKEGLGATRIKYQPVSHPFSAY